MRLYRYYDGSRRRTNPLGHRVRDDGPAASGALPPRAAQPCRVPDDTGSVAVDSLETDTTDAGGTEFLGLPETPARGATVGAGCVPAYPYGRCKGCGLRSDVDMARPGEGRLQ